MSFVYILCSWPGFGPFANKNDELAFKAVNSISVSPLPKKMNKRIKKNATANT